MCAFLVRYKRVRLVFALESVLVKQTSHFFLQIVNIGRIDQDMGIILKKTIDNGYVRQVLGPIQQYCKRSITKSFNTILPWFSSFKNKINCLVGMFL